MTMPQQGQGNRFGSFMTADAPTETFVEAGMMNKCTSKCTSLLRSYHLLLPSTHYGESF
jgi:hypothetical protein